MNNSKPNVNRRSFIEKLSLGTMGIGLISNKLSASSVSKTNDYNSLTIKTEVNKDIRKEFLLQPELSYFNTGSLGPTPKVVLDKVWQTIQSLELDPVSNNWGPLGNQANDVREQIAKYINADKEEILLTRNTTEGMNLIASGLALKEGDEIITSTHEHYGGQAGWEFLEKYKGIKIRRVEFPEKDTSTDQIIELIKQQITPRTRVCSLMDVSTITGMRMPFAKLKEITNPKGILLVCDGAQSAGMLTIDVKKIGIHAFATSGHKWLLGPKETGFLYISKSIQDQIKTIQLESGFKAYNHNTGTRNIANILGLGEAIKIQESWGGISSIQQHNIELADHLRHALKSINGVQLISPTEESLQSAIISILPKDKNAKEIYKQLKKQNITVKVLGKRNILRFSNHIFNTKKEIDLLVQELSKLI